jgi:hypothetical protein
MDNLSTEQTRSDSGNAESHLHGIYGWLLFFLIIFFLNSLNILSLPFTVRFINWGGIWSKSKALTVYLASATVIEFVAAVTTAIAGVLILMKRKAAVAAVNVYCLLITAASMAGLFMTNSMVAIFSTDIPFINAAHYSKYVSSFLRMDLEKILATSLYSAYVGVIIAALLFFLYFRHSRRVKATLVN